MPTGSNYCFPQGFWALHRQSGILRIQDVLLCLGCSHLLHHGGCGGPDGRPLGACERQGHCLPTPADPRQIPSQETAGGPAPGLRDLFCVVHHHLLLAVSRLTFKGLTLPLILLLQSYMCRRLNDLDHGLVVHDGQ